MGRQIHNELGLQARATRPTLPHPLESAVRFVNRCVLSLLAVPQSNLLDDLERGVDSTQNQMQTHNR